MMQKPIYLFYVGYLNQAVGDSMLQFNSLRDRLLILFAGMSFLFGLSITFYIGESASKQMKQASGQALFTSAKSISNTLANSLAEREREMVLLSQSPFFVESDFQNPHVQRQLDRVKQSYQYYAWLGIANPAGHIEVAADKMLQGVDVSERPWFIQGQHKVYLGDVHKAVLLAKILKSNNPNEPMRFIDFAAPIYTANTHQLKGVLAAHADWRWVNQVLENNLSENAQQQGIEVFIVNKDREILYPFKSIGKVSPPAIQKNLNHYYVDTWHTDQSYVTADVPVTAKTQMNLGWHVIIRQPMAKALQDVRDLQYRIMTIGLVISVLLFFITLKLANSFSRPIAKLAHLAFSVQQGQENVHFKTKTKIQEIQGLSQSLESMTKTLLAQKQQLLDANTTLEQKVLERTHALELANAELEKIAHYDGLTGLYNRRACNEYLQYSFEEWHQHQQSYAVLLMDIDYFKKINDSFGHEVGDVVLQEVAELIPLALRKTDFVARFGGEEFLVLLPVTDVDGAVVLAERIRQSIADAHILENYTITMSIGLSVVLADDEDANDAIRRADAYLYRAKAEGRNRVIAV